MSNSLEATPETVAPIKTSPAESRRFADVLRTNLHFAPVQGLPDMVKEAQSRIALAKLHSEPGQPYRPDRLPATTLVHVLLKRHQKEIQHQNGVTRGKQKTIGTPEATTPYSDTLQQLFNATHPTALDFSVLRRSTRKLVAQTIARKTVHHNIRTQLEAPDDREELSSRQRHMREILQLPDELAYAILWDSTAVPALHDSIDTYVQLWSDFRRDLASVRGRPGVKRVRRDLHRGLQVGFSRHSSRLRQDVEGEDLKSGFQRLSKALDQPAAFRPAAINALSRCRRGRAESVRSSVDWEVIQQRLQNQFAPYLSPKHSELSQQFAKSHYGRSRRSAGRIRRTAMALIHFALRQCAQAAPDQIAHVLRVMRTFNCEPDRYIFTAILRSAGDLPMSPQRQMLTDYAAAAFQLKPFYPDNDILDLPALPRVRCNLDASATAAYLRFVRKSEDASKVVQMTHETPLPRKYLQLLQHGLPTPQAARRTYSAEFYDELLLACLQAGQVSRGLEVWRAAVLNESLVKTQLQGRDRWLLSTRSYASALALVQQGIDLASRSSSHPSSTFIKRHRQLAWAAFRRLRLHALGDSNTSAFQQRPTVNRYILRLLLEIYTERQHAPEDARWFEIACHLVDMQHRLSVSDKQRYARHQIGLFRDLPGQPTPLWFDRIRDLVVKYDAESTEDAACHQLLAQLLLSMMKGLAGSGEARRASVLRHGLRHPQVTSASSQVLLEQLLREVYKGQNRLLWAEAVRNLEDRGWVLPSKSKRPLTPLEEDW